MAYEDKTNTYIQPMKEITYEAKKTHKKAIKLVGGVPLVCYELSPGGWVCDGEVDPSYKPKIPKGALLGDVSKQEFCTHCHKPKFYYIDMPFKCVACGKETVFSAYEQKHWFEVLHFNFHSFPIECKECRKKLREGQLVKVARGKYMEKGTTDKK